MIRVEDLKPGDVVYECDFDSVDDPIDPADVPEYVSKRFIIAHSSGLRIISPEGHNDMVGLGYRDAKGPVAHLHKLRGPGGSYAETEQEAIAEFAASLEGYAAQHAADAKVLRTLVAGTTDD